MTRYIDRKHKNDRLSDDIQSPVVITRNGEKIKMSVLEFRKATKFNVEKKSKSPRLIESLKLLPYSEYLRTPHWLNLRKKKNEIAGYKCEDCGNAKSQLNVHHRTYIRRGHELLSDLTVLCKECHEKLHFL